MTVQEREIVRAVGRLTEEFPDAPRDVIVSLLHDSYRIVEASRVEGPDSMQRAEELTRVRLESAHESLPTGS